MSFLVRLTIRVLIVNFLILSLISYSQTVTDVDGNIYNTIEIGSQTWLKENMKTLHYPDSTPIVGVLAYNNNDSLANIYGRLYNWNAAMNNSNEEKAQGICPDEWHVPSIGEWAILSQFLGGDNIAGGKMKEEGTGHWFVPNTGATNESGFTALPGGEKDNSVFWLMGTAAVIWSSSESSYSYAEYRYLSHDDAKLGYYNYYKSFYYSVRCIKNETVGINNNSNKGLLIYPNPADMVLNFEQNTTNDKTVTIYNQHGKTVRIFTVCEHKHTEDIHSLCPGIYLLKVENNGNIKYVKIIKK